MKQRMDLFESSDDRPPNVIDARAMFEAKVIAMVRQMIATNELPPQKDGQVIKIGRTAA